MSWEPSLSAAAGVLLIGVLSVAIGGPAFSGQLAGGADLRRRRDRAPSAESLATGVLAPQHVARFGAELFGRHLIAVEIAGVLLLVALVGAAVIVGEGRQRIE